MHTLVIVKKLFLIRKLALVPAAVLLLLPLVALYWDGELQSAAAMSVPSPRTAAVVPSPRTAAEPPKQAPAPVVKAPAPQATPAPSWEKAPLLDAAVTRAMANFPGSYSVAVQDLTSGQRWVTGAEERYHPASTIKMPVTLYALEQFRAGKLRWDEGIVYTKEDFESPGGGAFETAPFGGVYPVENLVGRALRYSNNVAVNMLGRRLGWENIRTWTRSIGADLYRNQDGSPEVTVLSELGWWLHLDRISRGDPKRSELILQPLREVTYEGRIPAGLPEGVRYLHKFGSYSGYYHDGGIVFAEQPYVLVVLTHGAREYEADDFIARVSSEVYKVMGRR